MPESIESVDIFNAESLVKDVYFGTILDKTKSLNSLMKGQFVQSISNDLKKQAPSSYSLSMKILRAAHIAGIKWLKYAQNVLVSGPSFLWFILKGGLYVRCWSPSPTFNLKRFVQACKCKKAKRTLCASVINWKYPAYHYAFVTGTASYIEWTTLFKWKYIVFIYGFYLLADIIVFLGPKITQILVQKLVSGHFPYNVGLNYLKSWIGYHLSCPTSNE